MIILGVSANVYVKNNSKRIVHPINSSACLHKQKQRKHISTIKLRLLSMYVCVCVVCEKKNKCYILFCFVKYL